MKMDLDYIKKLLNVLNDCDDDRVELNYLYTTLQISSNSESRPLEKNYDTIFFFYMKPDL